MEHKLSILILLILPFQYGLNMAILNAPMGVIGCPGVELPGEDCIPGWNATLPISIYAIGGLLGSAVAPFLNRRLGVESITIISASSFFIGSLLFYYSVSYKITVIARLFSGIGAGTAVFSVPLCISMLSPVQLCTLLGSTTQISINMGIFVAQFWGVLWVQDHWRRIMGCAALLSFAGLIIMILPAISIRHFRNSASHSAENHEINMANTGTGLNSSNRNEISQLKLFTDSRYHKTLLISLGIFAVQQYTGINAIIQYGVQMLSDVFPKFSKQMNLALTLVNLVMTIVGACLINKFGRKKLLISSLGLVGFFTALLSFSLVRGLQGMTAFASVFTIVSFAIGIGPIPFLYVSEIAPSEAVSAAQSLGIISSWISTFAVLDLFPKLQDIFGSSAFYFFSICTLTSAGIGMLVLDEDKNYDNNRNSNINSTLTA